MNGGYPWADSFDKYIGMPFSKNAAMIFCILTVLVKKRAVVHIDCGTFFPLFCMLGAVDDTDEACV